MRKSLLFIVLALTGCWASGQNRSHRQVSDLSNGLIAYFPFNGNANDESGNGVNPTYIGTGVTLTSDRFGHPDKAYYFDGNAGSYIRMPADILPTTTRTISLWFNVPDVSKRPGLLGYGGNGSCGSSFFMGLNCSGSAKFWAQGHCDYNQAGYSYTTEPIDNWYHWVLTIDGNTQKIYVNGELKSTDNTFSVSTAVTGKDLALGVISSLYGTAPYTDANVGYMTGKLDDIRIYDIALTEAQIRQLYLTESVGLIAYYPFNGNANDESGNENHGTITGALVTPAADRYGEEGKAYKFWFPDYVSVPTNSSFFTDEFTVSYWYKVASYWGDRGVLSCVGNQGGYQQVFNSGTTFTYLLGYNFPSSSWFWTNYTVPNTPNTWQHVTTTYKKTGDNSSVSNLYINGELKSSDTYANSIAYPGSEIFYIGRNHSDLGLNGELDDIRLYNKFLNDQEIKDLYLAETKPVLLQPANQSSVSTLTPEMRWSSPPANAEFKFQLSSDSLFGSILHELITTDMKTQIPNTLLTEGQNYYWRVQTILNGEPGPWSSVWSFNFVNTGIDKPNRDVISVRISPNPADASAKITYLISETGTSGLPVTIEILNSIGTSTKKLTAKKLQRGTNEIEIETGSLQSGIYYCRLKTGNISIVRKLVVMH